MTRLCACAIAAHPDLAGEELPATRTALEAHGPVEALAADLEDLALIGTEFDEALITTRNAGALISGRGGYGAFQSVQAPWRPSRWRVSLRVAPCAGLALLRSARDPGSRTPGSIVVLDSEDRIIHRVQYVTDHDLTIAATLARDDRAARLPASEPAVWDDKVVSLAAIRAARAGWTHAGTGAHLNDLIGEDAGRQRRLCLPHLGHERAWRILPSVLPMMLGYFRERRISFARLVSGPGLIQADLGPLERVVRGNDVLTASATGSVFSLALDQIGSVWVARCGTDWQLELYGHDLKAIAAFRSDPMADLRDWNDLLASLPRMAEAPRVRGTSG